MNKKFFSILTVAIIAISSSQPASALDLTSIFGNDTGNVITNLLEGVLTKSDITVADMAGTYTVDGSAVSFKSENALAKAGGVAASAAVEAKLDPYFKKFGLTGGEMQIGTDGSFTMYVKKIPLSGTIAKQSDGTFLFTFKALNKSVCSVNAYVQKAPGKLEVMFDATKMKSLLQFLSSLTNVSVAKTMTSLLDSYDGICVGFAMTQTSSASQDSFSLPSIITDSTQTTKPVQENTATEATESTINSVMNIFNRKK